MTTTTKNCVNCDKEFDAADRLSPNAVNVQWSLEQIKYCSEKCARSAENRRAYQRRKTAQAE